MGENTQIDPVVIQQDLTKSKLSGEWKNEVWIADDFDDLPENFMVYFREI